MKIIEAKNITSLVKKMCIKAAHELPSDVLLAIKKSQTKQKGLAKYLTALMLENAKIAKKELYPLCQDTGTSVLFVEIGTELFIKGNITKAIQEGVKQGYKEGYLRKSIVQDPLFKRKNTNDNTPAIIHYSFKEGDKLKLSLLLKGAGSENKSVLKMFAPSATIKDIKDFVLSAVKTAGASACPPFIIGIGIGGNFEHAALLSKKALLRKINNFNKNKLYAALEKDLLKEINKTKIGPQGLGGNISALGVFIEEEPCHTASLPVAVNIGCHVSRHITEVL
ncbi:MAG: fumarate hydratase [Elusimicrobiaceae bacterium]|nr:fumarate hydratase [Elusimicrobiaceae bacterium]MBQ6224590.1 fumarate hydratase [Campylobacter sp.]